MRQLRVEVGVHGATKVPIAVRNRPHQMVGRVVRQNAAQFIRVGFGFGRKPPANCLDVTNRVQKAVGLIEEGVLPVVQVLSRRRAGVKMIGNHVQRDPGLVALVIQKVFKEFRIG